MIKPFLLTLFVTLFFAMFNSQCGEKPGEGDLAKKGYENAKPIIEALEKYRQEKGDYPKSLPELKPQYLADIPLDENNQSYKYFQKAETKSYSLSFNYDASGIGICKCEYSPDTKKWSCDCRI